KRAYCLKTQPATGETYPKSDLFNKATLNRHGGQATLFILPEHGIHGNTHFAFADKNNQQIADIVENFLHSRGLDSTHQYHFQQNLQ
ncbi:hypothetical protein NL331_05770, partial [Klebsiella pneumoniae]|nr:hypothetical protein [Klebsiella pneumoniae]